MEERDERKLISDFIAQVLALAKNGEIGNGRSSLDNIKATQGDTSREYLAARIKRDRPDIAARIDDYPSIRAAAIDAGIIRVPTPIARRESGGGRSKRKGFRFGTRQPALMRAANPSYSARMCSVRLRSDERG
jgi:hypothetical protein